MARATSAPEKMPPVAMMVSKPVAAVAATLAAVGTPQSHRASPRRASLARGAQGLDAHPGGAARAGHVDVPHARRPELLRRRARQAVAGLLGDHGHAQLRGEPTEETVAVAKITVAAGLHDLHRGVEVHAQRVGAHRVDEGAQRGGGHLSRLHHAHVAEHDGGGRGLAHGVGVRHVAAAVHRALRPEAEAVAPRLGEGREGAVDLRGLVGAARHRGDEEGRAEALAEDGHLRVEVVEGGSGSASCTRRTHSSSVVRSRKPTSPVAQRSMWSRLRCPISPLMGRCS
jgi:hypothetical protein